MSVMAIFSCLIWSDLFFKFVVGCFSVLRAMFILFELIIYLAYGRHRICDFLFDFVFFLFLLKYQWCMNMNNDFFVTYFLCWIFLSAHEYFIWKCIFFLPTCEYVSVSAISYFFGKHNDLLLRRKKVIYGTKQTQVIVNGYAML